MDAWLRDARDAVAGSSGDPAADLELSDEDERMLLDLARIAAHDSGERTNGAAALLPDRRRGGKGRHGSRGDQ